MLRSCCWLFRFLRPLFSPPFPPLSPPPRHWILCVTPLIWIQKASSSSTPSHAVSHIFYILEFSRTFLRKLRSVYCLDLFLRFSALLWHGNRFRTKTPVAVYEFLMYILVVILSLRWRTFIPSSASSVSMSVGKDLSMFRSLNRLSLTHQYFPLNI